MSIPNPLSIEAKATDGDIELAPDLTDPGWSMKQPGLSMGAEPAGLYGERPHILTYNPEHRTRAEHIARLDLAYKPKHCEHTLQRSEFSI